MDFGKIPVDKVAYFVAGLVPGATALYIYYLANPAAFHDFLMPNAFGYRTKLCIAAAVCFVVGNTITLFAWALAYAFLTLIGPYVRRRAMEAAAAAARANSLAPRAASSAPQAMRLDSQAAPAATQATATAPWRDVTWRKMALKYLGDNAPDDTFPIAEEEFKRRMAALDLLPESERESKQKELSDLQVKLLADDGAWGQWYAQIDDQLRVELGRDFTGTFATGIRANLQATAAYLGGSLFFVPALRNWMCITFVAGWVVIMAVQTFVTLAQSVNPWMTWLAQREFLARMTLHAAKAGKAASEGGD
jgi:hypothetical protein